MVSTGLKSDEQVGGGPYYLCVHGRIYHQIGSLLPKEGNDPVYAQIYIYDTDEATAIRLRNANNSGCTEVPMRELSDHISDINPFAGAFKSMYRVMQEILELSKIFECTYLTTGKKIREGTIYRQRRLLLPFLNQEVGCHRHRSGISLFNRLLLMMSRNLDPLAYPILFHNGDFGWYCGIEQSNSRTNSQKKISQNKYAAYRLSVRDDTDIFHKCGKLFLQWVVDMYVRIETERLNYIRHHQVELRRDMYLNIYHYVQNQAEENCGIIGRVVVLPSSFIGSPRCMNERYQDAMSIVRVHGSLICS